MDRLRDIIAAFLADLTVAQHLSNERSKWLANYYKHDKILRFFPVPNGLLDEATLTLRFLPLGMTADAEPAVPPHAVEPSRRSVQLLASAMAAPLGQALAAELDESGASTEAAAVAVGLRSPRGQEQLTAMIQPGLEQYLQAAATGGSTEKLRREALAGAVRALAQGLAADTMAAAVLPDAQAAAQRAAENSREALDALLTRAGSFMQALNATERAVPDVAVTLDPERITAFPDYAVQSLTLRATLRNYKWIVVEEGGQREDQLVPEA